MEGRGGVRKYKGTESASKDAEIWKELLLKAKKGTTSETYFVVKVVRNCLHTTMSCKIGLPALFMHHHHQKLEKKIILEESDGHQWAAVLTSSWKAKPYITEGWKEFAAGHNLQTGDQVMFFLIGNSHFMVQVFDGKNNAKPRAPPPADKGCQDTSSSRKKMNKHSESVPHEEKLGPGQQKTLHIESQEVKASDDRQNAPRHSASAQVHNEALASEGSPAKKEGTNREATTGMQYMQCSTAEGHEYIQILDTSEEEDEKVTAASAREAVARDSASKVKPDGESTVKTRPKRIPSNSRKHQRQSENLAPGEGERKLIESADQMELSPGGEDLAVASCLDHPVALQHQELPKVSSGLAEIQHREESRKKCPQLKNDATEDWNMKHVVHEDNSIIDRKDQSSRTPPPVGLPSSPEETLTIKRSRKLQRKAGGFKEEDNTMAGYMVNLGRLQKLLTLSQRCLQEMATFQGCNSTQRTKADSKPVSRTTENQGTGGPETILSNAARGKRLASSCRAQQAMKKRQSTLQLLEETFSKEAKCVRVDAGENTVTDSPITKSTLEQETHDVPEGVVRAHATARDDQETTEKFKLLGNVACPERTEPIPQNAVESEKILENLVKPRRMESRIPMKSRQKIMVSKHRGTMKECSLQKTVKPVYKRPTKSTRSAPPKAPSHLYMSKRRPVTDQERSNALAAGQAYAKTITNQKFVLQLRDSQVYCGFHLGVPQEFIDAMQIPPKRIKVALSDFTGKAWEVEWLGDHPRRAGFHSEGWTRFVLEHYLEEGDVCVFELSDPLSFKIVVHIFPVVELTKTAEDGWQSHYLVFPCPENARFC